MPVPIYQVDAFTTIAFAGNPAAVCLLREPRTDLWMQAVAAEMNVSETAFLTPRFGDFELRWFSPTVEVDLCGHATLAAAHILYQTKRLKPDQKAKFHTRGGVLTGRKLKTQIELNFPMERAEAVEAPADLAEAIGAKLLYVGKNRLDYLVEVESETVLRQLRPWLEMIRTIPARGVIVTSASDSERYDFVSRFFAPGSGMDEDPVTGSAHCCLGPYWSMRVGKTKMLAYQASRRGGEVGVILDADRVRLRGAAVTVLRGELL